jgi:hypothetical protein
MVKVLKLNVMLELYTHYLHSARKITRFKFGYARLGAISAAERTVLPITIVFLQMFGQSNVRRT